MDRKTQQVGSSASFTSELFDSKESSTSPGIFGSIFAPSSKVVGMVGRRQDPANETWNTKHETHDGTSKSNEGESQSTASRDVNSIYQEQRVQQPCHLSSSIYYGGQDIYNHPQNSTGSTMNSTVSKSCNSSRRMQQKMIQEVLQEETGGRDLSITKVSHETKAYTHLAVVLADNRPLNISDVIRRFIKRFGLYDDVRKQITYTR